MDDVALCHEGILLKQNNLLPEEQIISFQSCGAPLAQWVKHWPVDLAVSSSSPARGGIFTTVNGVLLHTVFHYQFPSS